jgi:hypothetical protein
MTAYRVWTASALAALMAVAGCSKSEPAANAPATPVEAAAKSAPAPAAAGSAPEVYVQGLVNSLVAGDAAVMWNALPAKYQADVVGLKNEFAGKMDADLWNKGFTVAGKLASLLKDKKAMLLGSPLAAQIPPPFKPMIESNWDAVTGALSSLVNSEVKTLEGLKSADVGKFLGSTGTALVGGVMKAAMASDPEAAAKFAKSKIVLVKEEGDTAVLKMVVEGDPKQEEKTFKKVDGKWLPVEMVDGWDKTIADAKVELAGINVTPEMKAQFNGAVGMIEPILDKLLAAKDQAAFDGEIQGLLALAAMFGGGPPGGAMSGPPGAMSGPPGGAPSGLPGAAPGTLPGGVTVPPPGAPSGLPTLPPSTTPVVPPTTPTTTPPATTTPPSKP